MDENCLRTTWDEARLPLEEEIHLLQAQLAQAANDLALERFKRVMAQNGLTPYVYAIEALNKWLQGRNRVTPSALEKIMKRLGIWGVRVGYDPAKDVAISIIGDRA